ncbi:MAG TPA: hypothetical protein DCW97_00130 [Acidobacteria bacterium]|nr:hypothetical protein [Acidobacteriota bacterium]
MKIKKSFFEKLPSLKILWLIIPVFFISIQASGKNSYQAKTGEDTPAYQFQPAEIEKIKQAKNFMKKGVDNWDPDWLKKAREEFLGLLTKGNQENMYLFYYVALCDYRLAI